MLINRNNYETYFLDYAEGRLNAEEVAGLMAFLAQNPDLKQELDAFENIQLESTEELFSDKNLLRKTLTNVTEISEHNFEQFCIAKMEGDLDIEGNKKFEYYLAEHPERLKDYKLLLQTFLEPDKNIVFLEKQKLRHRQLRPNKSKFLISVSVAASVALIIISYQFYNSYREQNKKIYTAIHEKLKIDSLLIAGLGKSEKQPTETIQKQEPKKTNHKVVEKDTLYLAHTIFKPKKSIEIVQLDLGEDKIAPLAPKKPLAEFPTMVPLENRKSYLTVREYAEKELKKRLELEEINLEKDLTFWKAAETGVKQLNKLTGMNIKVNKEFDSINNRTKVIIHSNLLSFYSSTKK